MYQGSLGVQSNSGGVAGLSTWGKKIVRLVKAALAALGIVAVLALPAAAQSYPPDTSVVGSGEETVVAGTVQTPSGSGGGDALAATGGQLTVGTAVGGGLLVAGAAAVVVARRRGRAEV